MNNKKIVNLNNENKQHKDNLTKKEKELKEVNNEKDSIINSFKRFDNISKENEELKKNKWIKKNWKKVVKLNKVIKNSSIKDEFLTK